MLKFGTPKCMHFRESLIDSSILWGVHPHLGKSVTVEGTMEVENMIPAPKSFYCKEKCHLSLDTKGTLKAM